MYEVNFMVLKKIVLINNIEIDLFKKNKFKK